MKPLTLRFNNLCSKYGILYLRQHLDYAPEHLFIMPGGKCFFIQMKSDKNEYSIKRLGIEVYKVRTFEQAEEIIAAKYAS